MARIAAFFVCAVAIATAFLLAGGEEPVKATDEVPPIETIAERVEKLRGLEFDGLPKVRKLTALELQRESDRQLDKLGQAARARARSDQDLLALLGFTSRRATTKQLGSTAGILGVYDPPTKTLTIVTDAQGSKEQRELTYAHELLHALEDQNFGLGSLNAGSDDASTAKRATIEGSAHLLEVRYARAYLDREKGAQAIAERAPVSTTQGEISYAFNSDRFAYLDGARYIARLQRAGGQDAVDAVLADPPQTTEAVLHAKQASRVPVTLDVKGVTGGELTRVAQGEMGEFDTAQLLLFGALIDDETTRREAAAGAAGWDGGHYELWRAGGADLEGCSKPCVERDLLAIRWRFDEAAEADQFAEGLAPYLEDFQKLTPAGAGAWEGKVASAAVHADGRAVTFALAPAVELAQLVVRGA